MSEAELVEGRRAESMRAASKAMSAPNEVFRGGVTLRRPMAKPTRREVKPSRTIAKLSRSMVSEGRGGGSDADAVSSSAAVV